MEIMTGHRLHRDIEGGVQMESYEKSLQMMTGRNMGKKEKSG
jgi:hypothetical protein